MKVTRLRNFKFPLTHKIGLKSKIWRATTVFLSFQIPFLRSRLEEDNSSGDCEMGATSYRRLSKSSESDSCSLLPSQMIEKGLPKANARVISDAIIGLSDGLTVPFALTAGLSTLGETKVVIYGGLAELIAGAISMGLGGYLAAKSEEY
jgi:vacuolar iron transporter family protein